jgi:hypothetical protein
MTLIPFFNKKGSDRAFLSLPQNEPTSPDDATIIKAKEPPAQNYRFVIEISYGCRIGELKGSPLFLYRPYLSNIKGKSA